MPILRVSLLLLALAAGPAMGQAPAAGEGVWSFAVSGDSRDCGDLIVPKIAASLAQDKAPGARVDFYWHLGDFRRLYDLDCDIVKRFHPQIDCARRPLEGLGRFEPADYLASAWDDFIVRQLAAFGDLQVFLAVGNHELYAQHTREDVRRKFARWLDQEPIHRQRLADQNRSTGNQKGFRSEDGSTFYHFIHRGVDFITLDNADEASFSAAQLLWLGDVLAADAHDPAVRTIVVGMHEALPYSKARNHAMDDTCQGLCSGQQVYDLLYRAQGLNGPAQSRHVYVFASHSHHFEENVFDQPEHRDQVLPGWIAGTAGAEQYVTDPPSPIRYGYLEVAVNSDGTLLPVFHEVTRESPPAATGTGALELTNFCFNDNHKPRSTAWPLLRCACGAAP